MTGIFIGMTRVYDAQHEPISIMPNASPHVSLWNIVHVGYARVGLALGM